MVLHNNHRQILGYMLIQRAIVFLALYQYLYRLYSITTNSPTQGLQNIGYTYDNGGNITEITDLMEKRDSAR